MYMINDILKNQAENVRQMYYSKN